MRPKDVPSLLRQVHGRLRPHVFRNRSRAIFDSVDEDGTCAEIGVWKGDFSQEILEQCKPRKLHLVDPWIFDGDCPERWHGGSDAKTQEDMDAIYQNVVDRFSCHSNVEIHRMMSCEAVHLFGNEYFDWIYIDGDHSYDAVRQDLSMWWDKVKSGGTIIGDDYRWRDERGCKTVKRAYKEVISERFIARTYIRAGQFFIEKPRG